MTQVRKKFKPGQRRLVRFAAGVGAGLFLQGGCAWFLISGFTPRPHAALMLLMFLFGGGGLAWGCSMLRRNWLINFWHYLALALFLPFYGALGVLGIMAFRLWAKDSSRIIEDYHEYISDEIKRRETAFKTTSSAQFVRQELSIQSYYDILHGEDNELKKSLINQFIDVTSAFSVLLLREALMDREYEIRSFASSALTGIENSFNENILHAAARCEDEPENARLQIELARLRLDYLETRLPDPSTTLQIARETAALLASMGKIPGFPRDLEMPLLLQSLRTAAFLGDTDREKDLCGKILSRDPGNPSAMERLCTLAFTERRFWELPELCRTLLRTGPPSGEAVEAVNYWAQQPADHTVTQAQ